jgi:hypothetical protein
MPAGDIVEHQAEMAGIDARLGRGQAALPQPLNDQLMTAEVEDQGLGAAATAAASQPIDIPAGHLFQVDGRDREMETGPLHGVAPGTFDRDHHDPFSTTGVEGGCTPPRGTELEMATA